MGTEHEEREDSLAPVSVERLSVEEEVALINKGKGSQIFTAVGLVACLAAVGVFWLRGMDEARAYTDLAAATARLQHEQVDGFVHCVLTGTHASEMRDGGKLATALERSAERLPARYATTLARCAKKLSALHAELQTIEAPEDLEAQVKKLREAAAGLEAAALGYADALRRTDARTDAQPSAAGLGEAWDAYADGADLLDVALLER